MGIFLVGSLIQTMILVNDENYGFPAYQCTLLAIGAMFIAYAGSVYGTYIVPCLPASYTQANADMMQALKYSLIGRMPYSPSTSWPTWHTSSPSG